METKNFIPEIIIPGFIFLITIVITILPTILQLFCVAPSDFSINQSWRDLTTSQAAIISAVVLFASYSIGMVTSRIISDLFRLIEKLWDRLRNQKYSPKSSSADTELIKLIKVDPKSVLKTMENRYNQKSFYRSMFIAWGILGLTTQQWSCSFTMITFWSVEALLVISFFLQRHSFNSFLRALKDNPLQ